MAIQLADQKAIDKRSILQSISDLIDIILPSVVFLTALTTFYRFGFDSLAWAAVYGLTTFQILFRFEEFKKAIISSWLIFLVPLLTLISTFWSASQGHTFYIAFQFIYTTIFGVWLGATYSPKKLFIALFLAGSVGIILSVINGHLQFIRAYDDYNGFLIGIFTHKNQLGRAIIIFSVAMLVVALASKRLSIITVLAFLTLALLVPLKQSESATSLIMFLLVLTLPVVWLFIRGTDSMRLIFVFSSIGALMLGLAATTMVDIDLVNTLLGKLGKDSTLTGRTEIWAVGWEMVQWKPILGLGFDAFWAAGLFDEGANIFEIHGEAINGFHNTYLEVLVSTGIVGEIFFIATLSAVLFRVFRWLYLERSPESLGAAYLIMITVVTSFIEVIGFRNHDVNHLLMAMFYTLAYQRMQQANKQPTVNLEPEKKAAVKKEDAHIPTRRPAGYSYGPRRFR